MASAEEKTEIIQLVVGMVGAAPGAAVLAELEALFDGGMSLEDMAIAIAENPAFAGDDGLYPDFLPNAIFADQWTTALLGDSVTAENLQLAIDAVAGLLNSGTSRGAVMYAAVTAIAAVDPADTDFGAAASQLANQTEVAEYYSITVAQDGADIAALQAAIAGVTDDDATVATGMAAIDTVIAANQDVGDLIANLDAANDAKTAALADLDDSLGDSDPTPADAITQADVTTLLGTTAAATEAATVAAGAAAGYAAGSDALKAALISDAQDAVAAQLVIDNAALATALNSTTGTGSISGLDAAIASIGASIDAMDSAIEASALADVAATAALGDFNVLNGTGITLNANGTTSDGTTIVLVSSVLTLGTGVSEATDPGVDALLSAVQARETADLAETAAITAANDALDVVENLDQTAGRTTDLNTATALMSFITPATAGEATDAELAAELAALEVGEAQLQADILAVTFNTDDATTLADVVAILDAAETAGFITAAQNTTLEGLMGDDATANGSYDPGVGGGLPAALAAVAAGVVTNSIANDLDAAITTYLGNGTALTGGETVNAALALAPLSLAADNAQAAVDATTTLGTDVTDAAALEALVVAADDQLTDLDTDIADATTAFGDAGFAAPVTLTAAVVAATAADDLFLSNETDAQIITFSGDDTLFLGEGLTLNADTTAGDNGDNAVLEVWVTGTTDAVITVETSVFGSEAATPETYTITLLGVAAADVTFGDGFISV